MKFDIIIYIDKHTMLNSFTLIMTVKECIINLKKYITTLEINLLQ